MKKSIIALVLLTLGFTINSCDYGLQVSRTSNITTYIFNNTDYTIEFKRKFREVRIIQAKDTLSDTGVIYKRNVDEISHLLELYLKQCVDEPVYIVKKDNNGQVVGDTIFYKSPMYKGAKSDMHYFNYNYWKIVHKKYSNAQPDAVLFEFKDE